ncbi:hypothetical protein TNCV_2910451 [Trichonephila clavipes]|nr:hypothetical protein TNCV_2910451 [Trichonephila clavipes]
MNCMELLWSPIVEELPKSTTIHHHYSFSQKEAVGRAVCVIRGATFSIFVRGGKTARAGPGPPQSILPQNWFGTESNRTVTCMVLKATTNERRKYLTLCSDEFRGSRSDIARQVSLKTTIGETFLLSRVNEKFAHFCVTVKKRTEVVCPHPPNRHHDDRIESWEEKGEPGHHVTCVISVKKLDDCSLLRLVNLSIFLLGGPFPPDPGTSINGKWHVTYGVPVPERDVPPHQN